MNDMLLAAAKKQYEAEVCKYKANIRVYMNQSVGIGEHPNLVESVMEQINLLAEAEDRLGSVTRLIENHYMDDTL